MRVPYRSNPTTYDNYFKTQVGSGLPVFIGRGGLGNVLSGLFRSVIPIMKRGGKALLKEGVRTGLGVAQDVLDGSNFKTAVKRRASQAGKRVLNRTANALTGSTSPGEPATKRINRSTRGRGRSQRRGTSRTQPRKNKDIFG